MSNLALWLLVHAQQHTTNAGLHFGCTGTDEPLITLHAADWAIIWVSHIRYWRLHWVHSAQRSLYTGLFCHQKHWYGVSANKQNNAMKCFKFHCK